MSGSEYVPRLPEYMPEWDEIETGYHEYASQIAKQEWDHLTDPPHSFPEEFQDWQEPMHAARRWLTAHDARIASEAAEGREFGVAFDDSGTTITAVYDTYEEALADRDHMGDGYVIERTVGRWTRAERKDRS